MSDTAGWSLVALAMTLALGAGWMAGALIWRIRKHWQGKVRAACGLRDKATR